MPYDVADGDTSIKLKLKEGFPTTNFPSIVTEPGTETDNDSQMPVKLKSRILTLHSGWLTLIALVIVNIGILVHYFLVINWPRTHGWRSLCSVLGIDVEESKDCNDLTYWSRSQDLKSVTFCTPITYFGFRTFGFILYFGLHSVFLFFTFSFLRSVELRSSPRFLQLLDNVTFVTGLVTVLDILMVLGILGYQVGTIETKLSSDKINLSEAPFISHYWKTTQTEGKCCGVSGSGWFWLRLGDPSQSIPISCCNTNCSGEFAEQDQVWERGCLDVEYNYIFAYGWLHILELALQFGLVFAFTALQRRYQVVKQENFLLHRALDLFKQNKTVVPAKNTRLYYVRHTRDWEGYNLGLLESNASEKSAGYQENSLLGKDSSDNFNSVGGEGKQRW